MNCAAHCALCGEQLPTVVKFKPGTEPDPKLFRCPCTEKTTLARKLAWKMFVGKQPQRLQ